MHDVSKMSQHSWRPSLPLRAWISVLCSVVVEREHSVRAFCQKYGVDCSATYCFVYTVDGADHKVTDKGHAIFIRATRGSTRCWQASLNSEAHWRTSWNRALRHRN
mmetsp:Transcript_60509/g.160877  ORF Transcript_60509/g.160877 Transcript_60509/m.160877 type:complete len:106 (+) Transcript_60509:1459-1776(+)